MAMSDPVDIVFSTQPIFESKAGVDIRLVGFICKDGNRWRAFWGTKHTIKLSRLIDNGLMQMVTAMAGEVTASQYTEVIEIIITPPITERWVAVEVAIAGFEAGLKVVEEVRKRSI